MNRNDVFEKNLSALSEKDPQLAKRIGSMRGNVRCHLIGGKRGYPPNVRIEGDGGQILFYDSEDPLRCSREYLEGLKVKYAPFVFFMGLGLGYHLDQFMTRFSREWGTEEIIVYEKDVELFRLALHIGDYRNVLRHPNIHFLVGEDPEDTYVTLASDILIRDRYALRSIKIIPLPPSITLDGPYYLKAVEIIKKAATAIMASVGNDSFDSLVGLENMFLNVKHIYTNPGINTLYGKFRGKPGVLVAAGPSLSKNIHLLKGLENRALILSCDAAFLPLMKRGIRPHLVTSLERTLRTMVHYVGINDFRDIYSVTLPILPPETIDAFKGKKFIAYRKYSFFDWLENEKGSLTVGHSVANLAFKLLVYLGCDPIILIGQDLAFAKDGDTHYKDVAVNNCDDTILKTPVVELEGNDGNPVKSMKYWELFKLEYEDDIHSYTGTCVNATEGGARIRGAKIMTFADAIETYCRTSYGPRTILDETYDQFLDAHDIGKEMDAIRDRTKETFEIVERAIREFETALDDARLTEREIIRPSLESGTCPDADMERLLSVEKKWLELSALLNSDKKLSGITAQTLQAYDLWLASELSFLKDIYTNSTLLSMARVRKMTEWFAVIGSFLVFTKKVLRDAEMTLKRERQTVQQA